MLFRHTSSVDVAQLEEIRRQDARRSLERECRVLKRQFAALEKDHRVLRDEHDYQSQRLDSISMQSDKMYSIINKLIPLKETYQSDSGCCDAPSTTASFGDDAVTFSSLEFEVMQAETNSLINDRNALIQRNASLELQMKTVMNQFSSLLLDYEETRTKLLELKGAVASATSIEELGGWVQL